MSVKTQGYNVVPLLGRRMTRDGTPTGVYDHNLNYATVPDAGVVLETSEPVSPFPIGE
jgi:hypothetical protein